MIAYVSHALVNRDYYLYFTLQKNAVRSNKP